MSIFLVFLAVAVTGVVALFAVGRLRRDVGSDGPSDRTPLPGLVEPSPSLPPVLLPEKPQGRDVDQVRFALGLRGYRMDQVDEVLDRLAAALDERDLLIAQLQSELGERA